MVELIWQGLVGTRLVESGLATTSVREEMIQKRAQELMDSFLASTDTSETVAELRRVVQQYETRYGIASERIHDANESGELLEDQEVGRWTIRYEILRCVESD